MFKGLIHRGLDHVESGFFQPPNPWRDLLVLILAWILFIGGALAFVHS